MAQMHPLELPTWIREDPALRAELRVFDSLSQLDDDHHIFYRVAWHAGSKDQLPSDGEGDFIVAHPRRGFLSLEVKGGRIRYDAEKMRWHSTSRSGESHEIKDPAEQAIRTKYWLLRQIKSSPMWKGGWVSAGHGVIFPDTVVESTPLKPDLPRELVFDHEDLANPAEAIGRLFSHFDPDQSGPLDATGVRLLETLLASSFELRTPIGADLDDDVERLLALTEEQFRLLDFLGQRRRALIKGCAGSGKTMLAVEQARRLASRGLSVLLTCFNEPLSEFLRESVGNSATVLNFHNLCLAITENHGNAPRREESSLQEYYETTLPGAALDAVEAGDRGFDAIVVDEAQDFAESWWIILEALLKESENGCLYVFADNNQNIYRKKSYLDGLFDEAPFDLTLNCRNTRSIHEYVAHYYKGNSEIECTGPKGRPVEVVEYADDHDLMKKVRQHLHTLIVEGQVSNKDVVVLTLRGSKRTGFTPGTKLGNFTLVDSAPASSTEVHVSSVHRFKGLESKVILLVEKTGMFVPNLPNLLYIACSRAMTHLVIFDGSEPTTNNA